MAYKQLSIDTIIDYLKTIEKKKNIFSSFDDLIITEIGDGNLNFVYSITNKNNDKETVILKQSVPFLRCVGESYPLEKDRMKIEIKTLKEQYRLCPNLVPKIYYDSDDMCLVIMQNLNNHKVLRGEIIEGKKFPKAAEHLTDFLSNTLFFTSDYYLDTKSKKALVIEYMNAELCSLTEDFIFTHPFEDNDTNVFYDELNIDEVKKFQRDSKLKTAAAEMKYAFMTKTEALLHGDFHLGSFMGNEEETYIIDPEFAFYGPIGFDIGKAIANFFMAYISHEYHQKRLGTNSIEYRKWLFDTAKYMLTGTLSKFESLWKKHLEETNPLYWQYPEGKKHSEDYIKTVLNRIFKDAVGFAGCVLIRRTLGLAKNKDISGIQDLKERARLDWICLNIGREFLINRESIDTIDKVAEIVNKYSNIDKL